MLTKDDILALVVEEKWFGTLAGVVTAVAPVAVTVATGVNGEVLDLSYSSDGDTTTAHVNSYAINATVSDGTGHASNYPVTVNAGNLTVNPAAISYTIGNDSQSYGGQANLTNDLPATFTTGINGQTLGIAYASTGDNTTAHAGKYDELQSVAPGSTWRESFWLSVG